ncbi:FAD-dependent oxidoreductase [Vagococcus humatus]|uniref:dihydrouracil dehydrogenase (NAD(+)) n=1 Tax=Vagococcus humatus TaxID=1889241 RepID=A0A429Z6C5_9ENTE|nr:FAD-dependent oxidoreductase [Vagococcus humatus]RST89204.1 dihydropyrimidine dehydrogenase [Vagococcus humatus]
MNEKYLEEAEIAYTINTVMEEAQRCLLCHDAPCSKACPAKTDPAKFIRSVRFRNFKGAAETIRENNAMGSICALVCPTEKYCQLGCSRCGIDKPIDIAGIQRFVTDFEQQLDMKILKKGEPNGKHIAIVGSGPAGLQAAASLLQKGYAVTIYEQAEKPGGYLRYGIPAYRLPDVIVDYEIDRIVELGANILCGAKVGQETSLSELKENFDAVLIAVGASEGKMLEMFADNPYTETAVDFLARVRDNQGDISLPNSALVIGGGDVAMDAATTLKVLGVESVTDVAYETFSEFLASKQELAGAQAKGVTIIDGYLPSKVSDKQVTFKHRHNQNELTITADLIILAVGQKVNAEELALPIEHNEVTFEGYQTSDPQVFVAGDIAKGDKTVVWAVQKGKEAAAEIDAMLGGKAND